METYDLTIKQGATYRLVIKYPGDISAWDIRGMVRRNYADNSGQLLAEFEFDAMVYDAVTELTSIPVSIPADITETIPAPPKSKSDRDAFVPSSNCWVYDIEIINTDEVIRILYGNVLVSKEVTR